MFIDEKAARQRSHEKQCVFHGFFAVLTVRKKNVAAILSFAITYAKIKVSICKYGMQISKKGGIMNGRRRSAERRGDDR